MARRSVVVVPAEIERLRMAKKWDQRQLARKARVSQPTISRMEAPGIRPAVSLESVEKVAQALGVDVAAITAQTDDAGLAQKGQTNESSADYSATELSRTQGPEGDIRETPMGRIARFANPRLRLAFYDALALAEGLTDEEAEALADDLEEVAREERSRHARHSTDS